MEKKKVLLLSGNERLVKFLTATIIKKVLGFDIEIRTVNDPDEIGVDLIFIDIDYGLDWTKILENALPNKTIIVVLGNKGEGLEKLIDDLGWFFLPKPPLPISTGKERKIEKNKRFSKKN